MIRYSPNEKINTKIHKLLKIGVPPIPVAPKLDPKHPGGHRVESPEYRYRKDKPEFVSCNGEQVIVSGDYCKFTTTAVGCGMASVRGEFVRLDSTLSPTPLFTGKNPSFLGWDGKHRKLNHGQFQNRMPTEQELKRWFCNPYTGIGTLGGHNGIVWIDFDAKNYPTQDDCDHDVQALLDRIGKPTLTEKTGSGGYRVAVVPTVKPTFTNFSSEPGGKHLGEALFAGRYTVLAPSQHPNGNYYTELCNTDPVEVESLEAIGVYPSKDETQSQQRAEKRPRKGSGDRNTQQTFSDPVDNPWDIRNFAQFFEGYTERADGWGYAKCPAHNGTSLTSFRVRLNTGEFKLWCGCDTKAVFKAGQELAQRFGYKFQEKRSRNLPDAEHPEHGKTINREQWVTKHKTPQKIKALSDWIKQQFDRPAWKFWRRTGELPQSPQPNPQAPPRPDSHIIYYPEGRRLESWKQARKQGYKYILDNSGTGGGKSHTAGEIKPQEFDVSRVMYLTNDPRNVTTSTLKDWDLLEARHDGLVIDPNSGQIRRRKNRKDDRKLLTPANCGRPQTIAALRELNVSGADTSEKICKTCPHFDGCRAGVIQFNYLRSRAEVLGGSANIIAHPNSLPPIGSGFPYAAVVSEGDKDDSGTLLAVDEGEETIKFTKELDAKIKDVRDVQATLIDAQSWPVNNDGFEYNFETLHPILANLLRMISGEIEKPRYYGWNHQEIVERLGQFPEGIDLEAIRELLNEDNLINRILDPYESDHGVSLEDLPRGVKRTLAENDSELAEKAALLIKQQWLIAFLEVWEGSRNGYLSINHGSLNISISEPKLIDILKESECSLILSATLTRESAALILDCEPEDIAELRQIEAEGAELEIIQIPDLGRLSKQRGERQSGAVTAIISELRSLEPNTKVIDFKKFLKDMAWWRDSRGSNAAKDCSQLVIVGTPVKNLTALRGDFTALYGRPPQPGTEQVTRFIQTVDGETIEVTSEESIDLEFRKFVQSDTLDAFTQAIGRLRANRRPGEKLKIYILSNFAQDIPVQVMGAADITVAAGSPLEQLSHFVKETNITGLRDVATALGKAASTISQLVKRNLGIGWEDFITKLSCSHLLIKAINSTCEQQGLVDDQEAETFFVENFPLVQPEDILEEISLIVKLGGWDSWQRIARQLSPGVNSTILREIARVLPDDLRQLLLTG